MYKYAIGWKETVSRKQKDIKESLRFALNIGGVICEEIDTSPEPLICRHIVNHQMKCNKCNEQL